MRINRIVPAIAGLAIAVGLQTPAVALEHEVLGMYVNSGNANALELAAGTETTLDETTINCPRDTCTLALSAMQEIVSAVSQGEWGIVAKVDGNYVDSPYGPYQGLLPIAYYVTGNWQGKYSVSKGPHTVTFQIYPSAQVQMLQWSDSVFITTP